MQENVSKNIVSEKAAIFSRGGWVNLENIPMS